MYIHMYMQIYVSIHIYIYICIIEYLIGSLQFDPRTPILYICPTTQIR